MLSFVAEFEPNGQIKEVYNIYDQELDILIDTDGNFHKRTETVSSNAIVVEEGHQEFDDCIHLFCEKAMNSMRNNNVKNDRLLRLLLGTR